MIICPECGRTSDEVEFVGEFCIDCTVKRAKQLIPKMLTIHVCRNCNRLIKNGASEKLEGKSIAPLLSNHKKGIDAKDVELQGNKALVTFIYDADGHSITFDEEIKIKTKYALCNTCRKIKGGYYEAIVQLRGAKAEALLYALQGYVKANGTFISKVEQEATGYNAYVGDKKITAAFFSAYRLKPERSYTLYGMKNGKKLYRNTYLLRS